MQPDPHTATLSPSDHPRLRLKPKAPTTGYVDGAWWPRSRDLGAELPELLAVLAVRLGRIERVTHNLAAWPTTPRRIVVDGGVVRLEPFNAQNPATVTVIGSGGRLTLLVVAPDTEAETAHHMLMTAAHRGNHQNIETLGRLSHRS